jgi:glycosyltransferase involved in cell wall biosynthesis
VPLTKMPPLVSIITPAYKAARYIGATLESIQAQTMKNWECIVVDDGSPDDSAAVAERYAALDSRIRILRQQNAGPSAARNNGFCQSSPDSQFITFMDSDDLWVPDALETLLVEIEQFPEAIGAHGLADFIDAEGRELDPGAFAAFGRRRLGFDGKRIIEWDACKPTTFETLVWTCSLYPPGVLLARRSAYARAGLYDTAMPLCEDWDMAIRLSRFGEIRFVNKIILGYRRHSTNISQESKSKNVKCVRKVYWKTFFSTENNMRQHQIVRKGWRAWQVFKMKEKLIARRRHGAACQPKETAKLLGHIVAHGLRWLRGYPTARGI